MVTVAAAAIAGAARLAIKQTLRVVVVVVVGEYPIIELDIRVAIVLAIGCNECLWPVLHLHYFHFWFYYLFQMVLFCMENFEAVFCSRI